MNKQEAVAAMQAGQKVTHRLFSDTEWMTLTPTGLYKLEDGVIIPSLNFWEIRKGSAWDDGYSLVTEFNHQPKS